MDTCNKLTPFSEHGQQHHEEYSFGHELHLGYPSLHKTKNISRYTKLASLNIEISINSMTLLEVCKTVFAFQIQ